MELEALCLAAYMGQTLEKMWVIWYDLRYSNSAVQMLTTNCSMDVQLIILIYNLLIHIRNMMIYDDFNILFFFFCKNSTKIKYLQ